MINRIQITSLTLAFIAAFGSWAFGQPQSDTELWFGKLDAKSRHFRFLVELKRSDENWSGKLTSFDEGGQEFKLSNVKRTDDEFAFELKASGAKYEGKVSDSKVDGLWLQRSAKLELDFEQVEEPPREKLKAVWQGTLKFLFQELEMQIRELESGEVYFDSLKEKVGGFVATKKVENDQIIINIPALRSKFEGKLNDDGTEMAGTWKQSFFSPKLVLKKVEQPADPRGTQQNRPQTPKPPFPYDVQEVTFSNDEADVRLAGTLTLPKSNDKSPAVLLISGSGPQDRDETIVGHKPFAVIADHLTRNGIAVLRYDERGVGDSTGEFSKANSKDLAADAVAGLDFLKSHPKIDATKIGICGHSEGGYVAPMIAASNTNVAFIVMLAGPGVTGEKILISQLKLILKASRLPDELIESRSNSQQVFIELAKQKPPLSGEEYEAQALKKIQQFLTEEEKEAEAGKAMVAVASQQLRTPWFDFFIHHDPAVDLKKIKCPVLALNGSLDLQVDPKLNLPVIKECLTEAPTTDFKVVELPGLNHLFQNCKTGLVQEYEQIEETFDSETLQLMSSWILERMK